MSTRLPEHWLRERTTDRKRWVYWNGSRFFVEMDCFKNGRLLRCTVDGEELDWTHLLAGPGVRRWIRQCWEQHLESLTYHERLRYIERGLIDEAD